MIPEDGARSGALNLLVPLVLSSFGCTTIVGYDDRIVSRTSRPVISKKDPRRKTVSRYRAEVALRPGTPDRIEVTVHRDGTVHEWYKKGTEETIRRKKYKIVQNFWTGARKKVPTNHYDTVQERSGLSYDLAGKADRTLPTTTVRAAGVRIELSSTQCSFSTSGSFTKAKALELRTDRSGKVQVKIHGPPGWVSSAEGACRAYLEQKYPGQLSRSAREFVAAKISGSARRSGLYVRVRTLASSWSSGTAEVHNVNESFPVAGYEVRSASIASHIGAFVREEINPSIRPVTFEFRDSDTRTTLSGVRVVIDVNAPTPAVLVGQHVPGRLTGIASAAVSKYYRGRCDLGRRNSSVQLTLPLTNCSVRIDARHNEYAPALLNRRLDRSTETVTVRMNSLSTVVDKCINSKLREMTVVVRDKSTHAPLPGARVQMTITAPSPQQLLPQGLPADTQKQLMKNAQSYHRGRSVETTVDGRVRRRVYGDNTRVSLRAECPGYKPVSVSYRFDADEPRKVVELDEKD